MPHTILLIQPTRGHDTRTYTDYESAQECLEGNSYHIQIRRLKIFAGICKIYEEHLRQLNPQTPSITYDISELFKFIDNLFDLSCLVLQPSTGTYHPHNKEWIKEKIYGMLKKQANPSPRS
ncbi:hypothetical protein EMCRGX_G032232 [Ephydatia muelleri]